MKNVCLLFLFLFPGLLKAQSPITITQNDMPNVNDTLRVSYSADFDSVDPGLTGPNYTWDFSSLTPQSQEIKGFVSVGSTGTNYQFYFNNSIFYPAYKATVAATGKIPDELNSIVPVADPYFFYKESSSKFEQVGLGGSVSGIQIPVKYDSIDVIYNFPLDYQDVDSSGSGYEASLTGFGYYRQKQKRVNVVDGWGTLTTPFGTFQTLRIKSTLTIQDSIQIEGDSSGIVNDRVMIEYKWLANGERIPVLEVDAQYFFGTPSVYNIVYRDILRSFAGKDEINLKNNSLQVYPNPAKSEIYVNTNRIAKTKSSVKILNVLGKTMLETGMGNPLLKIDISSYPAGVYFIKTAGQTLKFIKD